MNGKVDSDLKIYIKLQKQDILSIGISLDISENKV